MRLRFLPLLLSFLLAACLPGVDHIDIPPPPADAVLTEDAPAEDMATDAPEETAVDGDATAEAAPALPSGPVTMEAFLPPPAPLPPVLRERQTACERGGGQLVQRGRTGLFDCLRQTRDSGRPCRRAGDCEGACLARSQSCAPFTPLFGCHEVLDAGGSRVTVCLE